MLLNHKGTSGIRPNPLKHPDGLYFEAIEMFLGPMYVAFLKSSVVSLWWAESINISNFFAPMFIGDYCNSHEWMCRVPVDGNVFGCRLVIMFCSETPLPYLTWSLKKRWPAFHVCFLHCRVMFEADFCSQWKLANVPGLEQLDSRCTVSSFRGNCWDILRPVFRSSCKIQILHSPHTSQELLSVNLQPISSCLAQLLVMSALLICSQ